MRFHFREVEVWASASLDELMGIVEEVQTKVKDTARDGLSVDCEMLFFQMPSPGSSDECWQNAVCSEFVFFFSQLKVDLLPDSIIQVDLSIDHVVPSGCI